MDRDLSLDKMMRLLQDELKSMDKKLMDEAKSRFTSPLRAPDTIVKRT